MTTQTIDSRRDTTEPLVSFTHVIKEGEIVVRTVSVNIFPTNIENEYRLSVRDASRNDGVEKSHIIILNNGGTAVFKGDETSGKNLPDADKILFSSAFHINNKLVEVVREFSEANPSPEVKGFWKVVAGTISRALEVLTGGKDIHPDQRISTPTSAEKFPTRDEVESGQVALPEYAQRRTWGESLGDVLRITRGR